MVKKPSQSRGRKNAASKSGKNKPVLPREVKSILDRKKSELVLFDFGKFEKEALTVPVIPKDKGRISINIAASPLDFYSSPHVINLVSRRAIEKTPASQEACDIGYGALPGGKVLDRMKVFDFFILENSEIVRGVKALGRTFKGGLKPRNPHLLKGFRAKPKSETGRPGLSDLSVFSLLAFIGRPVISLGKVIADSAVLANVHRQYLLTKDEELQIGPVSDIRPSPRLRSHESKASSRTHSHFVLNLRSTGVFAAICLALFLPVLSINYYQKVSEVKGQVLGQAETAIGDLDQARASLQSFDLEQAGENFTSAGRLFDDAQGKLGAIGSVAAWLAEAMPFNNTYKSGASLLEAGKRISYAGSHLSLGLQKMSEARKQSLVRGIKSMGQSLDEAIYNLQIANQNIPRIDEADIPAERLAEFNNLKQYVPTALAGLEQMRSLFGMAVDILGENDFRRYLVVFQNDNELRPSGGFIGSFALVDVKDGEISNIEIPQGGSYDVRAGFDELWKAPKPLSVINPRWELQDANWSPDWPTSARAIMLFYEKSGGPSVDGVIAVNSDWLGEVLRVTGPVELKNYGKTIDVDNFELELQRSIELEAVEKNKPKKILGELAPVLISRVFKAEAGQLPALASALAKGLAGKEIMVYLKDKRLQSEVVASGWAGELLKSPSDYLNVVYANIGGGKTDNAIKQEIYHKAAVADDGSITDTVLVRRSHIGPLDGDFTDKANREYVRFFVPKGSQLLGATGFEPLAESQYKAYPDYLRDNGLAATASVDQATGMDVYQEGDYTVFGNWVTVKPGQAKESVISYRLPFTVGNGSGDKYLLLAQKQPGLKNVKFFSQVDYAPSWRIGQSSIVGQSDGGLTYQDALDGDRFYWVELDRK